MREIVHIQAGQCGNQIGAKVSFPICIFHPEYSCQNGVIFARLRCPCGKNLYWGRHFHTHTFAFMYTKLCACVCRVVFLSPGICVCIYRIFVRFRKDAWKLLFYSGIWGPKFRTKVCYARISDRYNALGPLTFAYVLRAHMYVHM